MPLSALMNVMTRAVRKAGRSLIRDFGEVEQLQVSVKGPADFVTNADYKAEDILYEELSRDRPGYGFLFEERGEIPGRDKTHTWIIDPLDGTTNFLHGIPHFAISVGLMRDEELVAAMVYNPIQDEMYSSEKGKGAFLNDRRIRVAARRRLSESVVVTGIPHMGKPNHEMYLKELEAVMGQVASVRRFGSAALDLAYVAAGRFDAFWEHGLKPWDVAAGMLLVREAGGMVTDHEGKPRTLATGNVLAGNGQIHRAMVDLLKTIKH
ncbi:MAG: inositol monophosphatase family protein [Pseudomonadota bacterium]